MPSRTVAVGLSADPGHGRVDLILLPGECPPDDRAGLAFYSPENLQAALHLVRLIFADHSEILTLAHTDVVGTANPEWTAAIEERLALFIEDLGNSVFDCWEGARNVIRNGDRFKGAPTSDQLAGALNGKPAICLAAGPSATPEMLARIRGLKATHIVFCAEVMLGACRKAGFAPDFVTIVERPQGTHEFVKGGLASDSTLIATSVVDPRTVDEFPRVIWWRGGDRHYDWLFPADSVPRMVGRSTGVLSVAAAVLAGCNPIYLVGHDLAYGPGHTTHCATVHPTAPGMLAASEKNVPDCYGREQLEAEGWDGGTVYTNGFWQLFRQDIETILADAPEPRPCVLSCQDGKGARIAGVHPGEFPASRFHAPMLIRPRIPGSSLPSPRERVASILEDSERLLRAALDVCADLDFPPAADLNDVAAGIAISKHVTPANAPLWQYIFQTTNHALALRLALRPETFRDCLRLLAGTMIKMCQMVQEDLK